MPDRKLKVVVTRKLPDAVEARMRELFDVELNADDRAMTCDALAAAVSRADVLAPTVTDRIDAAVLAHAGPQLKLIANFGAGFEHIDVAVANARGITVTNTPGVLTEDTADMAMALILAVSRRVVEGAKALEAGRFEGWTPTWMTGRRIRGKSLGIIGMGRIGQALAKRAKAFGLSIHYHNRRPIPVHIAEALEATFWDSLDQMLARMDIVSLNCPHTPGTYHLLSARRLKVMPSHAILINTARGGVVDEAALASQLAQGQPGRRRPGRVRERALGGPAPAEDAQRRAAAPSRLGDGGGARRDGRQGHHQHQGLPGRPQAAGPGAAFDAVKGT